MRSVPAIEVPPNFITIRAKNFAPAGATPGARLGPVLAGGNDEMRGKLSYIEPNG